MEARQWRSDGVPWSPTRQSTSRLFSRLRSAKRRGQVLLAFCEDVHREDPGFAQVSEGLRAIVQTHEHQGGSTETEAKALAVSPARLPCSSRVVTTVTPVAKRPTTALKASESIMAWSMVALRPRPGDGSACRVAAVDQQVGAGHERGLVARQEYRTRRDLLHPAVAA